jgi:hypothetical protein
VRFVFGGGRNRTEQHRETQHEQGVEETGVILTDRIHDFRSGCDFVCECGEPAAPFHFMLRVAVVSIIDARVSIPNARGLAPIRPARYHSLLRFSIGKYTACE